MKVFRIRLLLLACWFSFAFNIERIDFSFLGLGNINLDTWVYILAAGISILILILPDLTQNLTVTFIPTLFLYMVVKSVAPFEAMSPTPVHIFVTEVMMLFITIILTRQIALATKDFEHAVEKILLKPNNLRVLPATEGEEKINIELSRARRFERPVGFLLIQMKHLASSMGDTAPFLLEGSVDDTANRYQWEMVLNERFTQHRIVKIVDSLIFKVDTMVWNNDDLVICLPETNHDEAMKLARNIYNQLRIRLNIGPMMGVATFPNDGLIYQDLLAAAMQNLVDFGGDNRAFDKAAAPVSAPSLPAVLPKMNPVKTPSISKKPKRKQLAFTELRRGLAFLFPTPYRNLQKVQATATSEAGDLRDPDFWIHSFSYQSLSSRVLYGYIKRSIDLLFAILIVLLASPILLLIAFAIKLDDGGDIFYTQERTGLGGRRFKMYKFRSMIMNAPTIPAQTIIDPDGKVRYVWPDKVDHDPRITRVGRILRKTSLDELPQVLNVLKGDMSVVGPRPTSWDLDKYTLLQTERLTVRPGITGLWQVSARETKNPDERLLWDTAYIDKLSLWLDIHIIWRTVAQVYQKHGV